MKALPARDATIYNDEMNPGTQPKSNPLVRQIHRDQAGQQVPLYILTDPWGSPYRYRLGSEQALPHQVRQRQKPEDGNGTKPGLRLLELRQGRGQRPEIRAT